VCEKGLDESIYRSLLLYIYMLSIIYLYKHKVPIIDLVESSLVGVHRRLNVQSGAYVIIP